MNYFCNIHDGLVIPLKWARFATATLLTCQGATANTGIIILDCQWYIYVVVLLYHTPEFPPLCMYCLTVAHQRQSLASEG